MMRSVRCTLTLALSPESGERGQRQKRGEYKAQVNHVPLSFLPLLRGEGGRRQDERVHAAAGSHSHGMMIGDGGRRPDERVHAAAGSHSHGMMIGDGVRRPDERVHRRGSVTILALVTLLILSAMFAQYTRRVLMERRQFRNEMLHQQAEKLADAGLQMAEQSRKKDPAWIGVTWNLPPGEIHQTNSAEVVIRMQDDSCTVVARYPSNIDIPFQVTRKRKLKL